MFIFRLLNIMVGSKNKFIMIKQGARLGKVWVKKSHVSQKIVLYFKGVTVKYRGLQSTEPFPAPQRQVAQTIW